MMARVRLSARESGRGRRLVVSVAERTSREREKGWRHSRHFQGKEQPRAAERFGAAQLLRGGWKEMIDSEAFL